MMVGSDCSFIFCFNRLVEDCSDPRTLLGLAGLFLDDGSENDELVWSLERQVGIAPLPDFPDQPVLRLSHALDHLLARESTVEMVAVRQKAAFPRHVLDIAGENVALQQARDDLLRRQSLGNGELVLHHFPFHDRLHHVA